MEERDYLYLKGTEELGEIIDILRNFEGKDIILVVPEGTRALAHPVNIEILKKELGNTRKKIYFNTEDTGISSLLKAAGFNVFLEEYEPEALQKMVTDIIVPSKKKAKTAPRVVSKKRGSEDEDESEDEQELRPRPFKPKRQKKFSAKSFLYVIGGIAVITGGVVMILNAFGSKATLTVFPKQEIKQFDEIIELRPDLITADPENQLMQGTKVAVTKTHTTSISATGEGRGGARAKGDIEISNSSGKSLSLVQGTRFQSSDAKIFRSTERVYVPANGSETVSVVADESGGQYNKEIGAVFSIPGLSGTSWEKDLIAKAASAISGGAQSGTKVVTLDDLANGKTQTEKELRGILMKELALKYPEFVFPEEIGVITIGKIDASHKVGQQTDKVSFSATGDVQTIAPKKEPLVEFLKDLVAKKNLQQQQYVEIAQIDIEQVRIMDLDPKLKFIRIQVQGKVRLKGTVNTVDLAKSLIGKRLEEIKNILDQTPGVENAEASLWPFWRKTFPTDPSEIEIIIE